MIQKSKEWNCQMLAEKIRNPGGFFRTREQGFTYFPGIFFSPSRK